MSWSAPSSAEVLQEFTPSEVNLLTIAQAGATNSAAILSRVVAEFRDAIRAGGYGLDADITKIPLGLHTDAIDVARWRMLTALPQLKQLQTDARKAAADRAFAKLVLIADQKYSTEPPAAQPVANPNGNWGSENKLIMRTHPVPRPGSQYPPTPNDYANPTQPPDATAA